MKRLVTTLALAWVMLRPSGAFAWMPYTHVYLGEKAVEAARSGHITVYAVDGAGGRIGAPIGTYKVDPDLLAAVLSYRGQYHAGLLGPDVYPDIWTGMYMEHDDGQVEGHGGALSDEWLERLWRNSHGPAGTHMAQKAFVVGYLQHAVQDMFAHDYVNWYTGGPYTMAHHDAIKHTALEATIARLTPAETSPEFYAVSVDGISGFMVDNLMRTPLLAGDLGRYCFPAWVEALRSSPLPIPAEIEQRIEHALDEFPRLSTEIALASVFNPGRTLDYTACDAAVRDYLQVMDRMLTEDEIIALYEKFKSWLPPGTKGNLMWMRRFRRMQTGLTHEGLQHIAAEEPELTGLEALLVDPMPSFDPLLTQKDPDPAWHDHPVTLEEFRRHELHMEPFQEAFDYRKFRPAYNSYVISELVLLGPDELRRLVDDLRSRRRQPPLGGAMTENVALGYIRAMDGDHQWAPQGGLQRIVFDDGSFWTIFMRQR